MPTPKRSKNAHPSGSKPPLMHFYRTPALSDSALAGLLRKVRAEPGLDGVKAVRAEYCFTVEARSALDAEERKTLTWLLSETFEPEQTADASFLSNSQSVTVVEIGPRLSYESPWCTNAVAVCRACGLDKIVRIERSRRYEVSPPLDKDLRATFVGLVHDRMTEAEYREPLTSFGAAEAPAPVRTVPVLKEGKKALERLNEELGLGFDDWDLDYYTQLFADKVGRDPTDVEVFDMAQSNSEHSRHWFFSGRQVINGKEMPKSLFKLVKETVAGPKANTNSVIAFHDNSSAIEGFHVSALAPSNPGEPSAYQLRETRYHPILTAETHNFPCGIAPFPGAETGTGGRIRDVQATGRGAHVVAGISSYCVGSLCIPGYELPWEDQGARYPSNMARPLQIEIDASNGASDYGNKFGEPVITGFTRSFGMTLPSGERREWIKPIMFSAGVGAMADEHRTKGTPEKGMRIVKVGGPAYRIGLGGGAASSRVSDAAQANLDFDAVQRGDAEMENKMNRVIRACIDMGADNPIVSIHDQGAGGNGNVLKEICEPIGGRMDVRKIPLGDSSLSVLEVWGAEYQENCALLTTADRMATLEALSVRENVPVSNLGEVTGDGRVVLEDTQDQSSPVDLELALVLGEMPKKVFVDDWRKEDEVNKALNLPAGLTVRDALDRVLRLLSVGSKRFLVNKVDRSVTGLVAQQQCVGHLHTPLADAAVVAQTFAGVTGTATAVGEQPIKGLVDPAAMARLTVAEALTNLCSVQVTSLRDIKASGNWMWAAKLPGEGAKMYAACEALRDILVDLGVAIDGGKDSLSMAASVDGKKVKCPGALVFTCYCGVPDVAKKVTPDLKREGSALLLLHLGDGEHRLGGSALAHCYKQLGDTVPDVSSANKLSALFEVMQTLVGAEMLLAAHDRSDGGLLVTLLEMAFAGGFGLELSLKAFGAEPLAILFAEEVGVVVEVAPGNLAAVKSALADAGVAHDTLGVVGQVRGRVHVTVDGKAVVDEPMSDLREVWEKTSDELELLQCAPDCARAEAESRKARHAPDWPLSYDPAITPAPRLALTSSKPCVAVLREEGSNGDREMAGAMFAAGMEAWDVTVSDLLAGRVALDRFRGVAFVGGFSYADVLDSAKGWAGKIRFNLRDQFEAFRKRSDTFSLGVCNGCQLMALLGWVPGGEDVLPAQKQPRFVHNDSGRFESRYSALTVMESNAVLLKGMAGSTLGVWLAHGEGKAHFPDEGVEKHVLDNKLAPLRYADDDNMPTEKYPFNPNGSPHGIAGLCSEDGRHLALMPHPERCFLKWQLPWMPESWHKHAAAPWLQLFQNAYEFATRE